METAEFKKNKGFGERFSQIHTFIEHWKLFFPRASKIESVNDDDGEWKFDGK